MLLSTLNYGGFTGIAYLLSKAQTPAYFCFISYRTDSQTGQFRILTGYDHSGIQVDFRCSEFIPRVVSWFGKVME
jgi:hypothetical protein